MALHTDCFNHLIDSRGVKLSCDDKFFLMMQRVKDYNGSFHYGTLVNELLKEDYLTIEELQLFLELCISRKSIQNKDYIEDLYQRIGEVKQKSQTIKGHRKLFLTPFGRKTSAHSRDRGELWRKRRFYSSAQLGDTIDEGNPRENSPCRAEEEPHFLAQFEQMMQEVRDARPLRMEEEREVIPLETDEESVPCVLLEEHMVPVVVSDDSIPEQHPLDSHSIQEEPPQDFLLYSLCGGKGECSCICHMMNTICTDCKRFQEEAKIFLESNPEERLKKKRTQEIEKKRKTLFSTKKTAPKSKKRKAKIN